MRKAFRLFWLMVLPIVLGLSACAEYDTPVDSNPLPKQVSGLWWALIDSKGTLPSEFEGKDYTRMGMAIQLNEDGTGYAVSFLFDNEQSDPVQTIGGAGMARFTYATMQNGHIIADFSKAYKPYGDYFKQFAITYADGIVTATNGETVFAMEHPSDAIAVMIQQWDKDFNGGVIMDEVFNPNDADFNHDDWRKQEGIYIYDGTGPKKITKDGDTYSFSLVALPWYTGGAVSTNLPMHFCDKITPENGWDLVMNYCGNTSEPNRNFFALYHKWTGKLRFFVYVPQGFSSGNDHMWQVITTGNLAMRQGHHYGLPIDLEVKDPAAIGVSSDGWSQYVSPWVKERSSDGLITLNAGWWAFDVDLSQYRPNFSPADDYISLQVRSWNKQNASFLSSLDATMGGSFYAKMKEVEDPEASSMRATSEGLQAAFSLAGAISHGVTGEFGYAFEALSDFVDHTFNSDIEANFDGPYTSVEGTINMTMNGTIDTHGIISGSTTVVGVSSPTFPISDFDTRRTQLGRGVWNLKTSPVVWRTNCGFHLQIYDFWHSYNSDMVTEGNINQYFPRSGIFYFFDPSSIEVELNPDLFPASQVEWTQVEAYCVNRAQYGVRGTDNYRKAFGLSSRIADFQWSYGDVWTPNGKFVSTFEDAAQVFDFTYYSDKKMDFSYPAIISTEKGKKYDDYFKRYLDFYDAVVGCGKAGSIGIEPMVFAHDYTDEGAKRVPALEVMVTLTVKVQGMDKPLVYVRHYLPEIKKLNASPDIYEGETEESAHSLLNNLWQNLKARQPKGSGINRQSPTYDYEMLRIGKILPYLNPSFKAD